MKRQIEVRFSKKNSKACNHSDQISIFWNLLETEIAVKYFSALQIAARTKFIYRRDRFYNFPIEYWTEARIVENINDMIDRINLYVPDLIVEKAFPGMSQDFMNYLHVYFEKYRGPLLNPAPLYESAPYEIKEAFDELNLMIHRYEDLGFSARMQSRQPKMQFTFGLNDVVKRYPLSEEDFKEFTFVSNFGTWSINYCDVGKPLHDVWRDGDEHVGHEVIIPLRYYSADGLVNFGEAVSKEQAELHFNRFNEWWDFKKEQIENLGFKKNDSKNSVGDIPVAELDRSQILLRGKSDREIVSFLSDYQWIESVTCKEERSFREIFMGR